MIRGTHASGVLTLELPMRQHLPRSARRRCAYRTSFALGLFVQQASRVVGHTGRLSNLGGLWSLSPLRRWISRRRRKRGRTIRRRNRRRVIHWRHRELMPGSALFKDGREEHSEWTTDETDDR